jgi:ParB family chromosome partitioning protein
VPKRGLPSGLQMRHDSHYVDELAKSSKTVGRIISINRIEPNPEQPRVEFGDLSELTASIKQNGVLEPILVKPIDNSNKFMIIAGERRWRASNLAGLEEVPCIELDIDEQSIAEIALIENLQRKDLTIWETADGLADLAERFGYTHDEIAKKIGKSRTTVTESMAIAGLPESIRGKCRKRKINAKSTLVEIARQFNEAAMHEFLDEITSDKLNRKQVRKKSRPKTKIKSKNDEIDSSKNNISQFVSDESFNYSAKANDFIITIRFNKESNINKKDILKALKEAFDNVKKS